MEAMVRLDSGEWYCPPHALLFAGQELISLYRAEGEVDWTAICEIINEALPAVAAKMEKWSQRTADASEDTL